MDKAVQKAEKALPEESKVEKAIKGLKEKKLNHEELEEALKVLSMDEQEMMKDVNTEEQIFAKFMHLAHIKKGLIGRLEALRRDLASLDMRDPNGSWQLIPPDKLESSIAEQEGAIEKVNGQLKAIDQRMKNLFGSLSVNFQKEFARMMRVEAILGSFEEAGKH